MALNCASASSQYLLNTASPITAYPFTFGVWSIAPSVTTANRCVWAVGDIATDNDFWRFAGNNASGNIFVSIAGGVATTLTVGSLSNNVWSFSVVRGISATNRRMTVLNANGSVSHGQSTASSAVAATNAMTIGANAAKATPAHFWNGRIAEFWYTATDIQADGAQLLDSTFRQLARLGPFSLPHVATDLIEYRSFWSTIGSDQHKPGEVYVGAGKTRQTWINTAGVTLGAHPPLPVGYYWPTDSLLPPVMV